jgi:carbamoyltransferase
MTTKIINNKEVAAQHLVDGKIVAIFDDSSEIGPRALGHRSILFDPRNPDAKEIINRVKQREWFRPFAGSILLEYVHDYFEMLTLKDSPWMTYAIKAKQKAIDEVPGIIHVDNTCRIQTVKKEDHSNFYDLICSFHQKTNVPILFNTSFNLSGEPIVETLDDAIDTLNRSEIDYLYIPT